MAIRATRVIGPEEHAPGLHFLPVPAPGQRWKTESWFLHHFGVGTATVAFELSPPAAGPHTVWVEQDLPSNAGVVRVHELVLDDGDSFAVSWSGAGILTLTVCAFVFDLGA